MLFKHLAYKGIPVCHRRITPLDSKTKRRVADIQLDLREQMLPLIAFEPAQQRQTLNNTS